MASADSLDSLSAGRGRKGRTLTPGLAATLSVLVVALGVAAYVHGVYVVRVPGWGSDAVRISITAWSFVGAGLVAWHRRPENRTGFLMVVIGFMQYLGEIAQVRHPVPWTIGMLTGSLWIPVFAYLLYSFPHGVLQTKFDRLFVGFLAVYIPAGQILTLLFMSSARASAGDAGLNLLLIRDDPGRIEALRAGMLSINIGLILVAIVVLLSRWRGATAPARRVLNPVLWTGLSSIGLIVGTQFMLTYFGDSAVSSAMIFMAPMMIAALPFGFLIGLLRLRSRRARVGDLLVELGRVPNRQAFQTALARTLGDPSLEVGFWSPEANAYLGTAGKGLALPDGSGALVATHLESGEKPLAVIIHDQALLDDPSLVDAVAAAAKLAVENENLHAEVQRQLQEVHESRARIVRAADDERRRVERNLHDGAQQRLVSLSLALRSTEALLADGAADGLSSLRGASKELEEAIREIRELARGIHPSILTDQGLAAAVEALASRSTLPLEIEEVPEIRLAPAVEATAYFIISEALANAVKHGQASVLKVNVRLQEGVLVLTIADDGIGGAKVERGGGLRGLVDRVEALNGKLAVKSPENGGTTLLARMPCGSSPDSPH